MELIERRSRWVDGELRQAGGFGAQNFLALFTALEQEQVRRGAVS
ncbi:hypothetical protein [Neosynechococcus sphagnicola]|nr:hypothetical protein [Neosynechococcus sphagnicola]